jgi:hypothetical protein
MSKQRGGNYKGTRRQRGKKRKQDGGSMKNKAKTIVKKLRQKISEGMIKYGKKLGTQKGGLAIGYPPRGLRFGINPNKHFMYHQ